MQFPDPIEKLGTAIAWIVVFAIAGGFLLGAFVRWLVP